jgi:Rrf2 family nitric oxide-sensitive transcriptional repressor
MRLTLYTEYALRVLMFVGVSRDRTSTIDAIAAGYGLSRNQLRKVIDDLCRYGFIEALQGRKGSIRLQRTPRSIRIGTVVRAMEQERGIVECFDPSAPYCRIQPACTLRAVMEGARGAFLGALDRCTLSDLIRPSFNHPHRSLADLLGLVGPGALLEGKLRTVPRRQTAQRHRSPCAKP